jgi:hypothetical protein
MKRGRQSRRCISEPLESRLLLTANALAVTYGSDGLATLSYDNVTLINTPANGSDGFQIDRYGVVNSDGSITYTYGGFPTSTNMNYNTDTLTWNYSWGSVACQYVLASSTRLNMVFTVSNTTGNTTLAGVDIYPNTIRFPQAIAGPGYPEVGYGTDGPDIEPANYGVDVMALVNDNVNQPLYTGLYTFTTTSTTNAWYIWVGTAPHSGVQTTGPVFNRDVAPGAADHFEISLRFGPAGTDPNSLATDVQQAYAAAYPDVVNWPDRRAIASLHLASTPTDPTDNPRGWTVASNINTTTPAGLQAFATDMLSWASNSITIMQQDHSQGMIVWDLEGEQYPQPSSTYIGDPRIAEQLAPEWDTIPTGTSTTLIDQFFALFKNAGLRTGMTIRPTQIETVDGVPTQTAVADEAAELEAKIGYAYTRWGSTLFYIDSNSGYDRDALAQVQTAYPQVLLIPEHSTISTYAYAAPYGQLLTYTVTGTNASTLETYPNGITVVYLADGDTTDNYTALEASVARGDIILFRGWWNDPYNATMTQLYAQAVPSVPTAPTGLSQISGNGTVTLNWSAVTGTGIYGTGVYNVKRSTTSGGPYTTIASGVFGPSYTDNTATGSPTYYYVVSAVDGIGEGPNSSQITATPHPTPTVATPAAASPGTVAGTTTNLSVLGADYYGESTLTYTWSTTSTPANLSQPTFSPNGTHNSKNSTATFHQAGTFTITATITDSGGLTITSSVAAIVNQTVTTLGVTPTTPTVPGGNTQQFSPLATDQFGNAISSPTVNWSITGGGTVNSSGVLTASQTGGAYTLQASVGSLNASTMVTIVPTAYAGAIGSNTYAIRLNPSNTSQEQIFVNTPETGVPTYTIVAATLPSLSFTPPTGDGSLTVDYTNGNPLPSGGITYTGGGTLFVHGISTGNLNFVVNATQVIDQSATSRPIAYSSLNAIEFDLSGGSNVLTQQAAPWAPVTFNAGTGNNMLNINAGSFTLATNPQIASGNLTINDNSVLTFTAGTPNSGFNPRALTTLNLGPGATATVQTPPAHSDRTLLVLGSLSVNSTAKLDMGGNDLLLHSTAANRASDLTNITDEIQSGFNGGPWNGEGIFSSKAAANPLMSLGVILNDDGSNKGGVGNPVYPTFDGQTALATDILVKYTYFGDANLDGQVNGTDYSLIDASYHGSATGWSNGNFNYDTAIDGSDYSLIDNAFNTQAAIPMAQVATNTTQIESSNSPHGGAEVLRRPASPPMFAPAPTISTIQPTSTDEILDSWRRHAGQK